MTELGEGVAVPGLEPKDKEKVKCEWKNCKKTHEKKPNYPKGGTVERNGSYESDWVNAKLEPWVLYGPGKDSQADLDDYREETPAAQYAETANSLKHPEYHTQKHHLISVNLFNNVSKLSNNAKLIKYDVNHKNNGICLPSYVLDIVQHDLQCHRGPHPKLYDDKIEPLLANLENKCIKYCEMDVDGEVEHQKQLIKNLNLLSARIERKIKDWKWFLRSKALAERVRSEQRFNNLKLG